MHVLSWVLTGVSPEGVAYRAPVEAEPTSEVIEALIDASVALLYGYVPSPSSSPSQSPSSSSSALESEVPFPAGDKGDADRVELKADRVELKAERVELKPDRVELKAERVELNEPVSAPSSSSQSSPVSSPSSVPSSPVPLKLPPGTVEFIPPLIGLSSSPPSQSSLSSLSPRLVEFNAVL